MAGLGAAGASGLFGGPSLAALGAGLLAGVIGGTALVSTGTVQFNGANAAGGAGGGPGLELYPCPDQAPVIGKIPRNQEVLVTARTEDGTWLQLYWPLPGIERAWTRAGPLKLEGNPDDLPVASCEASPTPTPRPTVEPTPSPRPTPSPSPTPTAAPTATPTPKPNARPKLSNLDVSTRTVSYDQGQYCRSDPKSVTFSVTATDADGIAGVTLHYKPPGAAKYLQKPMTLSGGRYVATLDTTADNLRSAGELRYYIVAKDANASPRTTKTPTENSYRMTVKVCRNTGPRITSLKASPTSIITNPLGVAGCAGSTLTEFQAQATDVDGVKSIRLYFKKPGASSYTSRSFSKDGDTWYSYINTVASVDNILRSGKMTWYVVATDQKGATTKTSARTITVTRCDSEASFDWGGNSTAAYKGSCGPNAITIPIYAADRDNAAAGDADSSRLKVAVSYRATARTGDVFSGNAKVTFLKGNSFRASIGITSAWPNTGYTLSYTISSTDVYGGKSSVGPIQGSVFTVSTCPL